MLCTHLHVDHVGWNTRLVDGRWGSDLPERQVHLLAHGVRVLAGGDTGPARAMPVPGVFEDSVLPIVEAGQALIVEDDHQIDDGMWIEPSPGHTPGHVMLNLASGAARGLMTGDVIHHPLQLLRPQWSCRGVRGSRAVGPHPRGDAGPGSRTPTRCSARPHFASPSMGHVLSRPAGGYDYRFLGE